MDDINSNVKKFDETILIGQSKKPSKQIVKKITKDALVIIMVADQKSLKKNIKSMKKIRKVINPKF
jgi:hypothetical protein